MALAHFHAGTVSRGSGRSAVDAASYVLRVNMLDQRTGTSYSNGRNAADAVHTFVWLPKNAPEQYRDAEALANYMEARETRSNSRTARTIEAALPHELTDEQRERLVKDFAREFTRKGLAVIVGIHKPHQHGDDRNHHFHMVVSTRTMDAQGLGAKLRDLDKVETLEAWRARWETLTNKQLERHGHEARIDMRSFDRQGRDGTPQIHIGPVAAALERKGIETDRGDQVRSVMAEREQQEEKGRAWTEGRPRKAALVPEFVPVVSAAERQLEEDRQAHRAAQRDVAREEARSASVPMHLRMMAAALRFLRVNNGGLLDAVMGRTDRDTIAASMRQERADQIEVARLRREDEQRANQSRAEQARERAREAKQARAEAEAEAKADPQAETNAEAATKTPSEPHHKPPPFSRRHAREEVRTFVDRGQRPSPFRAMMGELRDNERDTGQGVPAANDTAAVWSHERNAGKDQAKAPPAAQTRQKTYLEELAAKQQAKGKTLADVLPKEYGRKQQRVRDEGLGLDLEL